MNTLADPPVANRRCQSRENRDHEFTSHKYADQPLRTEIHNPQTYYHYNITHKNTQSEGRNL